MKKKVKFKADLHLYPVFYYKISLFFDTFTIFFTQKYSYLKVQNYIKIGILLKIVEWNINYLITKFKRLFGVLKKRK